MNTKDLYKNKYFSVLSDSIGTLEGYTQPKYAEFYDLARKLESRIYLPSDTWWGQVIDRFGGKLLVNNSISGSTVTKLPKFEVPSYGCSNERTSSLGFWDNVPDVIMVFLGLNDFGHWVKLMPEDESEEKDLTVFSSAYCVMIEKLKRNYPQAEIWCFTLPVSTRKSEDNYTVVYRRGKHSIEEFSDAIRFSAKRYGCRVIDIYEPENPYDTIDGLHPNLEGMKTLSDAAIGNFVKEDTK